MTAVRRAGLVALCVALIVCAALTCAGAPALLRAALDNLTGGH